MKNLTGQVISTKMQKVATVLIEQFRKHPLYGKILKRNFKIHAVNKIGAKTGDRVVITETRPVAKTVNFVIKEILGKKCGLRPSFCQNLTLLSLYFFRVLTKSV